MATKKPDPYTMTDREIELQIARDNLARYGSTLGPAAVAPIEVHRVAGTSSRKARQFDPSWNDIKKKCPHCGKTKIVATDFGVTIRRGIEAAQPWCRQCRANTDYRKLPRKNKVK